MSDAMHVEIDVQITMDDGLKVSADVFRPAGDGPYPVLLTYGPYAKALHFEDGYPDQWRAMCARHPDIPAGTANQYQAWELPDPEKWVRAGYVCVRVDSRGAGRSPGSIDPWSPREAQDLYDCIEWAGVQPWSNGKVGLTGISYYAINQWQAAALRPPHLAAICPWEGSSDLYREMVRHGGLLCAFVDGWYPAQVSSVQHGLGDRAATSRIDGLPVTGTEKLTDEELAANRVDFPAVIRARPLDDDYWAGRRADLGRIEVPLLSAANWGGPPHLRGSVEGYVRAGSAQKWLEFHGLEHWTHYYTDYGRLLQQEFFDHFLKGEDNGWTERPSVILNARHVDGTFEHRAEAAWPLPQTEWTRLYLDPRGEQLVATTPHDQGSISYRPLNDGVTFSYRVEHETEVTGPLAAKLFISSATFDADLFLVLRVFDPAGDEVSFLGVVDPAMPVTSGWLRASRRKIDPTRSTEYRPQHTHDEPQPLVPGDVYEVDVEVWPTSVIVPAGYTLALTVQGKDYENGRGGSDVGWMPGMSGVGPFRHTDPGDRPADVFGGTVTVHTGPGRSSYLLVPFVPRGGSES
jgi:predicted acyl esterase